MGNCRKNVKYAGETQKNTTPKVHQPFTTCEKCYGFVDDFANKRLYTRKGASLIIFVLVFRKKCLSYLLERRSVSPMPE